MIIICGKTIAEVERDLEMAKMAIASGMPYGVGGATIEDAERGLEMMQAMMGGAVTPIDNPNYHHSCDCGCSCAGDSGCFGCHCDDEAEEEEVEENTDPLNDFIEWLEASNAPADIISMARAMLE